MNLGQLLGIPPLLPAGSPSCRAPLTWVRCSRGLPAGPQPAPGRPRTLNLPPPQGAQGCLSGSETDWLPFRPPQAPAAPTILGKARAPRPGRQAHAPAPPPPRLGLSHRMPVLCLLQHDPYHNWPTGRLGRSRPADMFCLAEHSASKEFELVANFEKSDFT